MKILIVLAVLALILTIAIATRPDTFRVERSIVIAAPAETVFTEVNDFHKWQAWSPWEKLDSEMQRDYSGPQSGVGATYGWTGKKAGAGTMAIKESAANQRILIDLQFTKPMENRNTAEFTFVPAAEGTKVTWAMYGTSNTVSKAFSLLVSMDKLVGGDFEKGLAQLKAVSEKR